jgi:DNA-binding LacI/PurR family transcriptional regulator
MSRWGINLDKRRTRPPVQQERILADLREQIFSGRYGPGATLPTRTELESRYQVSPVTLQRAMDVLAAQGFVISGSQGTVVAPRLPHLCRYGLVYPARDTVEFPWGRFYRALRQAAAVMEKEAQVELPVFYCGEHDSPENRDYRVLAQIVKSRAIAGLLLLNPYYLRGTPILKQQEVPLVTLVPENLPEAPALVFDSASYVEQAMSWFQAQGRRRPAFINSGRSEKNAWGWNRVREEATRYGMALRPEWEQSVPLDSPQSARNTAHLLFANAQDRPDALLIADDNFVEAATTGLRDAGLQSAQEVTVIGHCNFPFPPVSHFPLSLLGYDSRQLLNSMVAVIERSRRQAVTAGEQILIPARFEALVQQP